MTRINGSFLLVCAVLPALLACPDPKPLPAAPVAATVRSFTSSLSTLKSGETTSLSWEVENATSVSIHTDTGEAVALPNGIQNIGSVDVPVSHTTLFMLRAQGEGGSDQKVASVVVPGEAKSPLFVAIPGRVRAGEKASLVWNVPGAAQIELRDGNAQPLPIPAGTSGTLEVTPDFTTTWTLVADGVETKATVAVTPSILAFQTDEPEVDPDGQVHLGWKVGGAEKVTLTVADRGILATATEPAQIADGSFVDIAPASLPVNGLLDYTLEATAGETTTTAKITVHVGANPVIAEFNVPEFVRPDTRFPISWKTTWADRVEIAVEGRVVFRAATDQEAREGTTIVSGVSAASHVVLKASNVRGGTSSQERVSTPVGLAVFNSFTANPTAVAQGGDKLTLSWDVTNARRVKVYVRDGRMLEEVQGGSVETGSVDVYPNKATQYVLEADNMVGDSIPPQSLDVAVTSPARLLFTPNNVAAGTPIDLTGSTAVNGGSLYALDFVLKDVAGAGFVDINGSGTPLPFELYEKSTARLVNLPQPFHTRWGETPVGGSNVSVSINGWLVFSDIEQPGPLYSPWSLPTSDLEPSSLVVFGTDLNVDQNGAVLWQMDQVGGQNRLIVQWNNVSDPYDPFRRATFQAQLYEDGQIVTAYKSLTGWATWEPALVGVISADENSALVPKANQVGSSGRPIAGSTLTFFGKLPLPFPLTASTDPIHVQVDLGGGKRLMVEDAPAITP